MHLNTEKLHARALDCHAQELLDLIAESDKAVAHLGVSVQAFHEASEFLQPYFDDAHPTVGDIVAARPELVPVYQGLLTLHMSHELAAYHSGFFDASPTEVMCFEQWERLGIKAATEVDASEEALRQLEHELGLDDEDEAGEALS